MPLLNRIAGFLGRWSRQEALRELRVFVASTLRDMPIERDRVLETVFPVIQEECALRGVSFGFVELRWGLDLEAAQPEQVVRACLDMVDDCRPMFLCFLADRYGWIPPVTPSLRERFPWLSQVEGCSITELEILHGALNEPENAEGARFYFRSTRHASSSEDVTRLNDLKGRIRQSGLPVVEGYADADWLAAKVRDDLMAFIEARCPPRLTSSGAHKELEHVTHVARGGGFRGQRNALGRALDAATRTPGARICVVGDAGSGRTCFLSAWAQARAKQYPNECVVLHHVDLDATSRLSEDLTRRLVTAVQVHLGRSYEPDATNPAVLRRVLFDPALKRLVWVIDDIDLVEVPDPDAQLAWLPELPDHAVVVASCAPGPTVMRLEEQRFQFQTVPILSQVERRAHATEHLLRRYGKRLAPRQLSRLVAAEQTGRPLFLQQTLEELRFARTSGSVDDILDHCLASPDTASLLFNILERMEDRFGRKSVRAVLESLWAADGDLREADLRDLTGFDDLRWNVLYLVVRRWTSSAWDGAIRLLNGTVRDVIERRYLTDDAHRREVQVGVATYLRGNLIRAEDDIDIENEQMAARFMKRAAASARILLQAEAWDELAAHLGRADRFIPFNQYPTGQERILVSLVESLEAHSSWRLEDVFGPLLEQPNDSWQQIAGLSAGGQVAKRLHRLDFARRLLERGVEGTRSLPQEPNLRISLGNMLNEISHICRLSRKPADAIPYAREYLSLTRDMGRGEAELIALSNLGGVLAESGDTEGANEIAKELETLGTQRDDLVAIAKALNLQAGILHAKGDWDRYLEVVTRTETLMRRVGDMDGVQSELGNRASVHMLRQEWEQAISLLEKRVEICRRTANSNGLVTGLQKLAAALEGACDYRRAIAVHQELQRLYERAGIYSLRRQSVVSEARDHGRLGNKEHAASLLERVAAEVSSAEVETEASALLEEARTWRQGEDPTGPVIEQNEERVVLRSIGRGEDVGQGLAAMLMVGAERRLEREGKWEELVEMYGGELWEGFRSRNQAWVQAAAQKLDKALRHSPHARLYDVPIKFVELEKGQWAALFRVWDLGMADRQGNRVPENGAVIGDSPVGAYFSAAEYLGNLQDTRDGRPFSMKVDKAETLRTTPIHQVLVAPDEMTAVYDSEGEQLTQYQGWWRDKGPLIMEDAPDGAKFFVASRPIAEQILRTNRAWGVHVR